MVSWRTHVVVHASSSSQTATSTPPFAGQLVQRYTGQQTPQTLPNGFVASSAQSHRTFSTQTYHRVEGFGGMLDGHPFVLDFYQDSGLFVGASYNGHPIYTPLG